ncbi:MAG: hypothetical protein HYZ43_10475 [Flavobacteriia bacterium]|nr:hypothetical protein [Flavobacteriia bacterium]
MEEEESFDYRSEAANNDKDYDKVLRPKRLSDFAGQPKVVENLEIFVQAATKRGSSCSGSWTRCRPSRA